MEEGLPRTQVLLWVAGEQLRAMFEHVVLAEYRCRYDWRDHKVQDIREGVLYPTRFASVQGALLPLTPQDSVVVYRAKPPRRRAPHFPTARWLSPKMTKSQDAVFVTCGDEGACQALIHLLGRLAGRPRHSWVRATAAS